MTMAMSERNRYDTVSMALHWITAVLMIIMVFFGEELMEVGEEGEGVSAFLPSVHVSFGVAILGLTVLRIAWRLANPPPPYPATMKAWEVTLSKLTHGLFYVLMIGLPLTGWIAFAEFLREEPALSAISVFGMFPLPDPPFANDIAGEIHEFGSKVAMALIILHVLAALKHQFIDRDAILRRMAPR